MNAVGKAFRKQFDRLALVIGLSVAVLPSARILAEGTLSTILSNGPTAKRINLVVLSEGYTTNELGTFLEHATNYVKSLLTEPPYREYSNYFNAFAISVASVQSGSDHPEYGTSADTYFNSSFSSGGLRQLITIPPNNFDANYSHGQEKVDALLQAHMPHYDLVIMIVNDASPGGSGNPDGTNSQPIITSLNLYGLRTLLHESGHTFGKLADEYETPWPGYVPLERPNATAQTNRALIKWASWIDTNTPLPTPETETYIEVVGLFEGAQYTNAGWYRPKFSCKMRDLYWPFCEVCSEQLVKSIYGLIRPIDSFLPASTNFSVYSTQAVNFSVTPLQPVTHDLTVQWYTNNVAVSGATNYTFQLLPKNLPSGTNRVRAVVHDSTELVRNDPTNLLSGSNTWTLNISLNELSLLSAQSLSGSRFRLTVTGAAPQGFVIQASTNLSTWISLTTNTLSVGRFDYTNSGLTNVPYRFYRTRSPP
jgi:hypothetical protein